MLKDDIERDSIMREILHELSEIKSNFPNGDLKLMQRGLEDLKRNQNEMKDSLSDLKKKLLDPEDGIIVKVNKNTDFRKEGDQRFGEIDKQLIRLGELSSWQKTVNKIIWIIFSVIIGIAVKMIFFNEI